MLSTQIKMAGAKHIMIRSYFIVILACGIGLVSGENEETISLRNVVPTQMNSEIYSNFRTFTNTNSALEIQLTDVHSSIAFIIVQAHSYEYNITLSYSSALNKENSVSGTNLGLYFDISKSATPLFYVHSQNQDYIVQWYLSIHGFDKYAPIPGGCNMEFPVPITPQLNLRYTSDVIFVEAAQAKMSWAKPSCERAALNVTHDFYRLYMSERDYSSDGYFSNIRKMITVQNVLKHGTYIRPHLGYAQLRRTFSLYEGTGSVYAVLAWRGNQVSVYVPTQTYGTPFSSIQNLTDISTLTMLTYGMVITMGFFICYFGHIFFKTEMFVLGLCSGGIVTYICLTLMVPLGSESLIIASLISGICCGAIWWMVWWFWGIPILSTLLASLTLGFLMASLVSFSITDGMPLLEFSSNYWAVFILIILFVSCVVTCASYVGNIIACAVLGSYAVVYILDHYVGSNLKYILVNTIRRATIPEFSSAILSPPFQWRDILLSILWIALCITGILLQKALQVRRPPFPPPPRHYSRRSRNDRNRGDGHRPSAPTFYQTFPIAAPPANVITRNITDPGIGYLQGSSERPTNERTSLVFGRRE